MKEELLKTVNETLIKSINAVDQTVSWVSGQIPDVIHQFLMWSIVSCGYYIVLGIVLTVTAVFGIRFGNKLFKQDEEACFGVYMVSGIFLFIGVIMILCNVYELLFIYFAPKIYLIKYTAALLK